MRFGRVRLGGPVRAHRIGGRCRGAVVRRQPHVERPRAALERGLATLARASTWFRQCPAPSTTPARGRAPAHANPAGLRVGYRRLVLAQCGQCAKLTPAQSWPLVAVFCYLNTASNQGRVRQKNATLACHIASAPCRWGLGLFPCSGTAALSRRTGRPARRRGYSRDRERRAPRRRPDLSHRAWNRAGLEQRARQVAGRRPDQEDQFFRGPGRPCRRRAGRNRPRALSGGVEPGAGEQAPGRGAARKRAPRPQPLYPPGVERRGHHPATGYGARAGQAARGEHPIRPGHDLQRPGPARLQPHPLPPERARRNPADRRRQHGEGDRHRRHRHHQSARPDLRQFPAAVRFAAADPRRHGPRRRQGDGPGQQWQSSRRRQARRHRQPDQSEHRARSTSRRSSTTRRTCCGRASSSMCVSKSRSAANVVAVPITVVQQGPSGPFAFVVGPGSHRAEARDQGRRHEQDDGGHRFRPCARRARGHRRSIPDPGRQRGRGARRSRGERGSQKASEGF